jgi:Family of unknown function (DUF5706)
VKLLNNDELNSSKPQPGELCEQLDRHLDWIKSCDTKASIVLAVVGILLGIFTSEHSVKMLDKIFSESVKNFDFANFLYLLFFFISICFFVYGAYCLIRVLVPRLSKEALAFEEGIYTDSLYFFEAISKNNFEDYKKKVLGKGKDDITDDILSQIYINAKICTVKFSYYSKGVKYSFIGLSSGLLLFLIGIILVKTGGL